MILKKRQGLAQDLRVDLVRKEHFQSPSSKFQMSEGPDLGEIVTWALESIISALLSTLCLSVKIFSLSFGMTMPFSLH